MKRNVGNWRPAIWSGFTLIELLIAVFILSVLMAIALPLYVEVAGNAEYRVCRANMQSIANALQAYHSALRATTYPSGTLTLAMVPDMQILPSCPDSGTYSIVAGTGGAPFNVHCTGFSSTGTAHSDFRYSVDDR